MKRSGRASVFRDVYQQPYNELTRTKLYNSTKGTLDLIQRLRLMRKLPVHSGCVNSICWNETGEYILSGSDDQHIVITHGYNYKVLTDYKTSHRANIFSAKFLPASGDTNVISCSGDGIILYTDLLRREETHFNQFNCHSGTTYEVITLHNDPHTFLSCGEDGTVRWFDLRIKNKCTKPHCKDDVMITCPRAVTALSMSPLLPYQLAIGCSDSTVRLFDRRMLTTIASGGADVCTGMKPLCSFTVPSFEGRSYRITSLCFSPEGTELLVSYSSDHLYLFSIKEQNRLRLNAPGSQSPETEKRDGNRSPPPVRRLRLRGDWSDTGPNARPEREGGTQGEVAQARPTLHATLMQRMTDVLMRMLNDPATRAALSGGGEDSVEREEAQARSGEQQNSAPPVNQSTTASAFSRLLSSEVSRDAFSQVSEAAGEVDDSSYRTPPTDNDLSEPMDTSPVSQALYIPNISVPQLSSLTIDSSENDNSQSPSTSNQGCFLSADEGTAVCGANALDLSCVPCNSSPSEETNCDKVNENEQNLEADVSENVEAMDSQGAAAQGQECENEGQGSQQESETSAGCTPQMNFIQRKISSLQDKLSTLREGFIERHKSEPAVRLLYSDKGSSNATISLGVGDEVTRAFTQENESASPSDSLSNDVFTSHEECAPSSSASEPLPGPSNLPSTSRAGSKYSFYKGPSGPGKFYNSDDDDDDDDEYEDMDDEDQTTFIAIERKRSVHPIEKHMDEAINNARHSKTSVFDDSDNFEPLIKQKYTGHRNARTMIKEATFWGDNYVLSGSDCGHVFIWDRFTGSLVMLLEADRHVVNCLQPHPVLPILATSGIDYDVKLWAPLQEEPNFDKDLAEVALAKSAGTALQRAFH